MRETILLFVITTVCVILCIISAMYYESKDRKQNERPGDEFKCPVCDGEGVVYSGIGVYECQHCDGTGFKPERKTNVRRGNVD